MAKIDATAADGLIVAGIGMVALGLWVQFGIGAACIFGGVVLAFFGWCLSK